jgi:hypothetical protein
MFYFIYIYICMYVYIYIYVCICWLNIFSELKCTVKLNFFFCLFGTGAHNVSHHFSTPLELACVRLTLVHSCAHH